MKTRGMSVILALMMSINNVGCQTAESTSTPICEYRTGAPTTQKVVAESGEFSLRRGRAGWPIPSIESSAEVTEVFVERTGAIGFRNDGGRLMAVAGSAAWPLEDGHYTWKLVALAGKERAVQPQQTSSPLNPIVQSALGVVGIIIVVPVFLAFLAAKGWYQGKTGGN